MKRRLIAGWGNPLVGDDGFGWRTIEILSTLFADREDLDLVQTSTSAMRLVERFLDYEKVILIDAAVTGEPVGTIVRTELSPTAVDGEGRGGHDEPFLAALRRGRELGAERFPREVVLYRCTIELEAQWKDTLSPPVEAAARAVAHRVRQEIEEGVAVG